MDKTSLGFQKPKEEEYYDINIFNQNAQLANDMIEKNSSAIGQKLDKDSNFYADLEAYYGNTKLIDDFQDISKYVLSAGQSFTEDLSNVKIGNNSIKLTSNSVGMSSLKMNNIDLDLTKLNNGEISSDEDYVYFSFYISDITKLDVATPNAITIRFSQSAVYSDTDSKIFQGAKGYSIGSLTNGWNFLKLKKSEALTVGNGSWTNIKSCFLAFVANTTTPTYVSFQLIQLVKADPDTLLDRPNPFQKFGVKEFDINSGEWFVGYEFGNLVCKELLGDAAILSSLTNPTVFQDFIISARIETNNIIKRFLGAVTQDGTSYFYIQTDSSGLAQIVTYIEGTTKVTSRPFKVSAEDSLTLSAERRGSKIIATYTSNGDSVVLTAEFNVSQKMKLALGRDGSLRNVVYSSASITEISHAHHSDIAENLAESGKLDLLRKPKLISLSNNKIMQLGYFNYTSAFALYAKIMRPNLRNGNQLSYADLYIGRYSSSYSVEGKLQYTIDLVGDNFYRLRFVITDTGKLYAISPLYNYSDWIIIENKNFTEDIQEVSVIDGNIVWDSDNNTTKIALQQTPTETVITSGFASGWSGQIRYRKNQENKVSVFVYTTKSTDITGGETIYTLPVGFRPLITHTATGMLMNTGGTPLAYGNVWIDSQGSIKIGVLSGQVLTNARLVYCIALEYYS